MYKLMVYQDTSHVDAQPRCHVFEFNTEEGAKTALNFLHPLEGIAAACVIKDHFGGPTNERQ